VRVSSRAIGKSRPRVHTSTVDKLKDFSVKDTIVLDNEIFVGVGHDGGTLGGHKFYIGDHASRHSDRIIYNENTGKLYYDPDGKGGEHQIKFAVIPDHLKLTHDDFSIV
jgi:Ca2+-binding RTX toxin-like protein